MISPQLAAKGGSVTARQSRRKASALAALHAWRRGRPVNSADNAREVAHVLALVHTCVREPVRGVRSIRVVAARLHVSDRTVRRWLGGIDQPPAAALRAMRAWVRELGRRNRL